MKTSTTSLTLLGDSVKPRPHSCPCDGLPLCDLDAAKAKEALAVEAVAFVAERMATNTDPAFASSFECSLENAVDHLVRMTRDRLAAESDARTRRVRPSPLRLDYVQVGADGELQGVHNTQAF
jgi:hypothetical protein